MRRLAADRKGAVAVLAGVGMTAIIGMTAFAIDLGTAYAQRARLQAVADSAAMAGAVSWVKTGSATAVAATVKDVVLANGWAASVIKTTAAPTAAAPSVTVSLAAPSTLPLAHVLVPATSVATTGYAVATVTSNSTAACLLSLSTLMVNGSITLNLCAAVADAITGSAITVNSGASLSAGGIATPGGIVSNGSVTGTVKTGALSVLDPYLAYQALAALGFLNCQNYSNQTSLTPGCWSNVNINNAVTLAPGTYFFQNGLNVNSGGSITGTGGVTMVVQNTFSPNGNITLTAPTTGAWAGMALYLTGGFNANSNITYAINGAVYAPGGAINLNGGTWNQSTCTYLVGQSITSNAGANFTLPQYNCGAFAYPHAAVGGGASKVALVQ